MIERFVGNENRNKRIKALCDQYLLKGSLEFAEFFADKCKVLGFAKGNKIISQGETDVDLFFIVAGSVDIYINNRLVAVRCKGLHVGEMALLDDTVKRSADVIASEDTVVFKIKQEAFVSFANANPELWRRIAIELSNRLRERSKFVKIPNAKPMVFIGSSTECLEKAKLVQKVITDSGIDVKCWDDNELFTLSETTLDELVEILKNYDFALFYVSGDDKLETRGATVAQPRDNVLLELGMSIGSIGKSRTFILLDQDSPPNLPSDLKGITYLPISFEAGQLSGKTIKKFKEKVVARIFSDGAR